MPKKIIDLDLLKDFRQKYDTRLKNGTLVPAKAQIAEQIANVSEDVGSTQEEPFIFQATATDNGLDSVETAPIAKHLEKQGNSVVVNQWLGTVLTQSRSASGYNVAFNGTTYKVSISTTTASEIDVQIVVIDANNYSKILVVGHSYLVLFKDLPSGCDFRSDYASTAAYTNKSYIIQNSLSDYFNLRARLKGNISYESTIYLIDLTQWGFTADEITDLTAHPEHFFNYYNGSLAYNTGTLTNSNGRYLKCIGRNQWDEEWEVGQLDASGNDQITYDNRIRSKNFIRVIPNAYYNKKGPIGWVYFYDKNKNFIDRLSSADSVFQVPSNCLYMRFYSTANYGSTYNHDITISIYYADGTDYDQYFPYEENTYDTGTEVLRSAGSVRDIKLPDGSITRKVGVIDLGSLTYTYSSTRLAFEVVISDMKAVAFGSVPNNISTLYKAISIGYNGEFASATNLSMAQQGSSNTLMLKNTAYTDAAAFKTAMSGVYLYYELATPTEEQGTSFAENVIVDNYGSMGWLDTDNNFVSVPQGSEFFYPADYVEFLDSLYTRSKDGGTSADVSNIVVQSELSAYVKQIDVSDQITDVAGLTYVQKKAYKTGNIVTITIQASNGTGSSIAADTTLFKLGSSIQPINTIITYCRIPGSNTSVELGASGVSGNCSLESALSNGATMKFTVNYIIE